LSKKRMKSCRFCDEGNSKAVQRLALVALGGVGKEFQVRQLERRRLSGAAGGSDGTKANI
jgi:hypothetical protein